MQLDTRAGLGQYASAPYAASSMTDAKFTGFEPGGHTWVAHNDEARAAIVELLTALARP